MMNLNKVMLVGNLTHDPDVRYTAKGNAVADFSIALNRTFAGEAGERTQETTFIGVIAWNKNAEFAREYFSKGRRIFVEGRLQQDSWKDKRTGEMRHKLRVVADRLDFADSKPSAQHSSGGGSSTVNTSPGRGAWLQNRRDQNYTSSSTSPNHDDAPTLGAESSNAHARKASR